MSTDVFLHYFPRDSKYYYFSNFALIKIGNLFQEAGGMRHYSESVSPHIKKKKKIQGYISLKELKSFSLQNTSCESIGLRKSEKLIFSLQEEDHFDKKNASFRGIVQNAPGVTFDPRAKFYECLIKTKIHTFILILKIYF